LGKLKYSIPKSAIGFFICLIVTILLNLIIIVPREIEEQFSNAIKTKNKLIIPGIQ